MFINIFTKIIISDRGSATFIMVPAKEVLTIRQDLYTVYTCTFHRTIIITRVRHLFMVSTFSRADVKLQILLKCVLYVLSYILILVFFKFKKGKTGLYDKKRTRCKKNNQRYSNKTKENTPIAYTRYVYFRY